MSFYINSSQIPASNSFATALDKKCSNEFNEFLKEAQRIGVHDLGNLVEKASATSQSKEEGFDAKLAEMIFACGISNKTVATQSFWLDVLRMEISIKVKEELFFHALRHRDYLVTSTLTTTLYSQGVVFSYINSDDLILLKDFIIQFWHHCKEMDKDISIQEQVKLLRIFSFTSAIISSSFDTDRTILSSCWKSLNWKERMPTEILGIIVQNRVDELFDTQYVPTAATKDKIHSLIMSKPDELVSFDYKTSDIRIVLQEEKNFLPFNQQHEYGFLLRTLFVRGDIEQFITFLHYTEARQHTINAYQTLLYKDLQVDKVRDHLLLKSPLLPSYFKLSVGINPRYEKCLVLLLVTLQIWRYYREIGVESTEVRRYAELADYLFDLVLAHPKEDLQNKENLSTAISILDLSSLYSFRSIIQKSLAFSLKIVCNYCDVKQIRNFLHLCAQMQLDADRIDWLNRLLEFLESKALKPWQSWMFFCVLLTCKLHPLYLTYDRQLKYPKRISGFLKDWNIEELAKKICSECKEEELLSRNLAERIYLVNVFFSSIANWISTHSKIYIEIVRGLLVDSHFSFLMYGLEYCKVDFQLLSVIVNQLIQCSERSTLSLENQQRLLDLHWKLIAQQNSLSSILNIELQKTFVVRLPKGGRTSQEHVERLQGFLRTEIGTIYSQMNSSQFKIFLSLLRYLWSYQSVELDKYLLFVALNSIFKSTLISSESMRRLQLLANVFLDFYEKDTSNQGEKEEMKVLITECLKLTASWMELVKIDSSQKKTTKDKTKGIQTQFKETSKELSKLNVQIFDSSILHRSHVKIQSSKLIVAFHLAIGSNGWDLLEKSLKKAQEEETKKNQSLKVEPKLVKSSQSNLKTSKKDPSVASSSSVKKQVASSRKSKTFDSKEKLKSSSSSIDHHADQILPDVNLPLSLSSFEPEKIKELSLKDKLENLLQKIDKDLDRELLTSLCKEIILILSEFERDKKDEAYQALAEKLSKVRKVSLKAVKIITEEIKEWTAEDFDELLYQIGIVSCSCRTMELIVQVIGNPIKKKRLNDLWAFKVSEEVKNQRKQLERRGTLATIVPPSHQASSSRASAKDMQRRNSHQSLQRKSSQQHLMAESSSSKSRSRSGSFAGDGVGITFPTKNVITTYASEIQEMPSNLKDLEYKLVTLATDQKFLWQITTDAGSGHRKCTLICQLTGQDYGSLPISVSGGKAAENVIEDIYRQQFAWIHHCVAIRKEKMKLLSN